MTSYPPIPYPYGYETITVLEMIYILWIFVVGFMVLAFLAWALVEFGQIAWRSVWKDDKNIDLSPQRQGDQRLSQEETI